MLTSHPLAASCTTSKALSSLLECPEVSQQLRTLHGIPNLQRVAKLAVSKPHEHGPINVLSPEWLSHACTYEAIDPVPNIFGRPNNPVEAGIISFGLLNNTATWACWSCRAGSRHALRYARYRWHLVQLIGRADAS